MASVFFRGHGKGSMLMSENFQPTDVLKYAFFFNVKKLEANVQKLGEHHIHFVALIRNKIKEIFLFKLVVRNALLHTGHLLTALLWVHSQASVLPTS